MRFDTANADRITAIVLFVLGTSMLIGGLSMDRLEIRRIHPASIPGLVPIFLGGVLMLCASLLFWQAKGKTSAPADRADGPAGSWRDLSLAALWSIIFAVLLVGNLPFFVATAVYVAVFVGYFSWPRDADRNKKIRAGVFAVIFALVLSGAVSALFRYGFLVRLP